MNDFLALPARELAAMSLDGAPQACFKPADEEPFCANTPRLFVGTAMPGTREAPEAEMRAA